MSEVRTRFPLFMPSSTVENYLKTILHLEDDAECGASVGAIAEELKVTPGTVSVMMRNLAEEQLIDYVPRRSITLLPKGRDQAMQVVRRHRLIETFLVQVMKLDWSEVHEEAEVLEHVISDRLLARIDEMLGHPALDPHGEPIPNEDGEYPPGVETGNLAEVDPGGYRLVRVDDTSPEFLDWIQNHDLMPGTELKLVTNDSVAGLITISTTSGKSFVQIGEKAASRIIVQPL